MSVRSIVVWGKKLLTEAVQVVGVFYKKTPANPLQKLPKAFSPTYIISQ
jgi:hypothetical protein